MHVSPIITAKDFSTIHNALCELDSVANSLENVINPVLLKKLINVRDNMRAALRDAYDQDHAEYTKKSDHYQQVGNLLGLRSVWSNYDVVNLWSAHPYNGATHVTYENHWGKNSVTIRIIGDTWADLWRAADLAIRDSSDDHHIFIEDFNFDTEAKTLQLHTGS